MLKPALEMPNNSAYLLRAVEIDWAIPKSDLRISAANFKIPCQTHISNVEDGVLSEAH